MANILDKLISHIRITSAYGPDLVIPKPFEEVPPEKRLTTQTEKFFRTMKPRFEIGITGSSDPIVLQPYGKPPKTQWGTVMVLAGLGGGILVALAIYGLFRVAKPMYGRAQTNGLAESRLSRRRRSRRSS